MSDILSQVRSRGFSPVAPAALVLLAFCASGCQWKQAQDAKAKARRKTR